jgi:WD40 repeat protein
MAKFYMGPGSRTVVSLISVLVGCALASCASTPGRDRALNPVMATALCSDGRTMVVSTNTSEVALFDVSPLRFRSLLTREEAKTKPSVATIMKSLPVACSPTSKLVVAAGLVGEVVGWDVDSGSVHFRSPVETGVVGLAFFPDGQSFVTVGPAARHWSAENGSALGEFKSPSDATATSVAVSPDGRIVLAGLSSGEIAEFDALTMRVTRILKGHSAPVTGLAFSPDGSTFASTAGRFDPRIWNRAESTPVPRKFSEVGGMGKSLDKASHNTQPLVLFTWLLGTARGFQIVGAPTMGAPPVLSPKLEQAANEPSPHCGPGVAYSPNGRFLAATANISLLSGEFHLMLADMTRNEGRVISGIYGCSVAFTRDSKFMVTGGLGAPQLWNAETGERVESE